MSTKAPEPVLDVTAVPPSGRYDVFLSYARVDKEFVVALTRALEARGKNVFVDLDDIPPGADWHKHVWRGIETSKVIVFVLSPDSVQSRVCLDELEHAVSLNKRIVPVVRRTVDPDGMAEYLTAPNWIWLRDEDDADKGQRALVEALERDEQWLDGHARYTVRAQEWENAGRDRSYLISGSDLHAAEQWLAHQGEYRESATALQAQYILDSRHAASRRRRMTLGGVVTALVIAVVLAVVAVIQSQEAQRQSRTAQSRELAAAANAQLEADPELSMLLAAEGTHIARTSQATAALRTALSASRLEARTEMAVAPDGRPAVSPDGRFVLQGGRDGAGRVYDTRSGAVVAVLRPRGPAARQPASHDAAPEFATAFHPGGRLVATIGSDGAARVWDWRSRRLVATLPGVGDVRVAFAPGGRVLAVGASLWDWRRKSRRMLPVDDFEFYGLVAFDASGRYLVGSGINDETRVWDVRSRRVLGTFDGLSVSDESVVITSVAFSPDGRRVVRGTIDGVAEVWDWRRRRRLAQLRPGGLFAEALFRGGGSTVLIGTTDGRIRVWDWAKGEIVAVLRGHRGPITGFVLAPDGRVISTGADRTIRRWAIGRRGSTLAKIRARRISSIGFSRDGRFIVTGGASFGAGPDPRRIAEVVDTRSRRRVASLAEAPVSAGDHEPWLRVAFSHDGRHVAGASDSGVVHVWDWRTGRALARLRHGARFVGDVAFSPDGRTVATTTADRGLHVWAWRERRLLKRLVPATPLEFPGRVDIAPGGEFIAVGEGSSVRVWDWRRDRVLARLRLPSEGGDVNFDPTGRLVAVSADDGVARVFDWRRGDTLAELLAGSRLPAASFSPDGGLLLTGGGEVATIWDWRLEQRIKEVREPRGLADAGIEEARFSPDGSAILTAGGDGRAHLYACEVCAPLDDLLELARRRATRSLNADERRRYLHGG